MVAVYRTSAVRAESIATVRRRVLVRWRPHQTLPDVPENALAAGRIGGGTLTAGRLASATLSAGRIDP